MMRSRQLGLNPVSFPVLGIAALISAPALWACLVEGTMPLARGLFCYIATIAGCWILLETVCVILGPVRVDERAVEQRESVSEQAE